MDDADLIAKIDHEAFVKEFLKEFLEDGFGALPKRQIDLLVLQLLIKCNSSWDETRPSDYEIARALGVSPRKIRTMLDDIAFGDETKGEDWCRAELRELLKGAEKHYDKGKVKVEIDDGLVRAYATYEIRKAFGIVDTSFNRTIIELSGDKYAGLIIELMDETERESLINAIPNQERNQHQDEQNSKGGIRLFIESFAQSAGNEAGKKSIQLGFAVLTGGLTAATDLISEVIGGA